LHQTRVILILSLGMNMASAGEAGLTRLQRCEKGIRTYFAYEDKGWSLAERSAPQGANACRDTVGDVEQTSILIPPECGSYSFSEFESPEKKRLKGVKTVVPADTVLDVISKARAQFLTSLKRFCGMTPPPEGVSQDASDCSWFIEVQQKYYTSMRAKLARAAMDSAKVCYRELEAFKAERFIVPEACRRYTFETFPGEDAKHQMTEELSEAGNRAPRPTDNMADLIGRVRASAIEGMKRNACDRVKRSGSY